MVWVLGGSGMEKPVRGQAENGAAAKGKWRLQSTTGLEEAGSRKPGDLWEPTSQRKASKGGGGDAVTGSHL